MATATNLYTRAEIRWQINLDMPDILAIEAANSYFPWSEEDYISHLRHRSTIGMVAVRGQRVIGQMLYTLERRQIDLLRLGVHPQFQRQGVGHQMVQRLKGKLSAGRRTRITFDVPETALGLQMFLRSEGFLWTVTFPEAYGHSGEDCYRFAFEIIGDGSPSADVPGDDWLLA